MSVTATGGARRSYAVGPDCGVSLVRDSEASPLMNAMEELFAPFETQGAAARTVLEIAEGIPALGEPGFRAGRVRVRPSAIDVSGARFDYRFEAGDPTSRLRLRMRPTRRRGGRARWAASVDEATSYHGLWAFMHLALLRHGCGFAHGGAVVGRDGGGRLLVGAGGSGKTSTTLALVDGGGWRYQAEDYALLDAAGRTFLSPRPLTVYHSDVRWDNPVLTRYEAELPLPRKLAWRAAAAVGRNPRHRVRFDRLFRPDQVERSPVELSEVWMIRRTTADSVLRAEEIAPADMVEHLLGASARELFALHEPMTQALAAMGPETPGVFTVEGTLSATRSLYAQALTGVRCVRITASEDASPRSIARLIDPNG